MASVKRKFAGTISSVKGKTASKVRGRPATGKSRDPKWRQTSIYLKRSTHSEVVYRLGLREDPLGFSELVDELLKGWLKS